MTVLFDVFFTVILFKHFYSKLVRMAGFSRHGREWMANFVVSSFLGVATFAVYTNLTRFRWAYPSGIEVVSEQWISGSQARAAPHPSASPPLIWAVLPSRRSAPPPSGPRRAAA